MMLDSSEVAGDDCEDAPTLLKRIVVVEAVIAAISCALLLVSIAEHDTRQGAATVRLLIPAAVPAPGFSDLTPV
jgi:hypothetical protein